VVPTSGLKAFGDELSALKDAISRHPHKTLRDDVLRERIRMLFGTWMSTIKPEVEPLLSSKQDFIKIGTELEGLAKLTSKFKAVSDYKKRLKNALQLVNSLGIYLPPSAKTQLGYRGDILFLSSIPDLPLKFVPNSLLGWKSNMDTFVSQHHFDRSVFIMVKYRTKNNKLIKSIKASLARDNYFGVLASDHKLTDDLYNPIACLLCCSRGIAIFDQPEPNEKYNPNVAYELGMMHLLGRECLILKHKILPTLQTDILAKLYKEYRSVDDAAKFIHESLFPVEEK
jgi:hypothetical protein